MLGEEPTASRPLWSGPCPTRRADKGVPELCTNATSGHLACFVGAAAFTHPGARLRDHSHPLQLRYFLRPLPRVLRVICRRGWPPDTGIPTGMTCTSPPTACAACGQSHTYLDHSGTGVALVSQAGILSSAHYPDSQTWPGKPQTIVGHQRRISTQPTPVVHPATASAS